MRMRHVLAVAITVGAVVVVNPVGARADGGAYMEFDRTHYLPGETATAEAYVYLLKPQQHLLDRGPFYAYVVTNGSFPQRGRPIPAGAIRVGTFDVEESRPKWFELTVSFTVPDITGDFYNIAMCNDPCTTPGFKEPILGYISIVQTVREATLLTQAQRLRNRVYAARRAAKKQEKTIAELHGQLQALDLVRTSMASQMSAMSDRLAAAPAPASTRESRPRPLLAPSTGIALVLALFALAAWIVGRTQRGASVPALGTARQDERRRDQHQHPREPTRDSVEPRSHVLTSRSMRR
jgi:uncharacterized coiled-coil protein SlyX